jgi:GNAT superfamily N-acetyltransferase
MKIELAETDQAIQAVFPVLRELRELTDPAAFVERVRSQQRSGYLLAVLLDEGVSTAAAGFRLGESLAWGRHVYIDDLVTLGEARSRGHGSALLQWVANYGRSRGAGQLHLDSGQQRVRAHRFYEREGLQAASLHFHCSL